MAEQISKEEILQIARETAEATAHKMIDEMKKQNLFKRPSRAFEKTEQVLYSYIDYKMAVKENENIEPMIIFNVEMIENALLKIKDDSYFNIIVYRYFQGRSIDDIAGILKVDNSTVNKNKTRLINRLKIFLFPDEAIEEMLE